MISRSLRILILAGASLVGACATKGTGATPGAPIRDPNLITEQDLADPSVGTGDALTAVRKLRPGFLMTRGTGSIQSVTAGSIHVSMNNGPLLSLSELSGIRAADVKEIRYINASDAAQRFGTAAGTGGVLLVKTR